MCYDAPALEFKRGTVTRTKRRKETGNEKWINKI